MSGRNKVIRAYKQPMWLLKLSKMQRVGNSECCQLLKGRQVIFGTGGTFWILGRVVWGKFSWSRLYSDSLLQIQVQIQVPCVFFYW